MSISIHALLAESDGRQCTNGALTELFLSTLSLRRATYGALKHVHQKEISIHALLAESDGLQAHQGQKAQDISIHALLAESDSMSGTDFYRSAIISIHALLAESDAVQNAKIDEHDNFYPRSPCGERPGRIWSTAFA